jgi:hypothetical protein
VCVKAGWAVCNIICVHIRPDRRCAGGRAAAGKGVGSDVGFQQVDVLLRDTFPAPGEILQL